VLALQELVSRGYPEVPSGELVNAASVARAYGVRLAGLECEVVLGLALDGRNHLLQEIELARGGVHGAALTPVDVFRPLIRIGASAFILVHNHPSGDPTPSAEDVHMTRAVAAVGDVVGIGLLDHIVIGARGGGWTSLFELGVVDPNKEESREQSVADQTV
jgi:DNA repair protein RadC